MILTEEELKELERCWEKAMFDEPRDKVKQANGMLEELVTSHRELLKVNTELNIKLMKYKEAMEKMVEIKIYGSGEIE